MEPEDVVKALSNLGFDDLVSAFKKGVDESNFFVRSVASEGESEDESPKKKHGKTAKKKHK